VRAEASEAENLAIPQRVGGNVVTIPTRWKAVGWAMGVVISNEPSIQGLLHRWGLLIPG